MSEEPPARVADAYGVPPIVWQPDPTQAAASRLADFTAWLHRERGVDAPAYADLHAWSVGDLGGFWSAVAEYFGVRFRSPATAVIEAPVMPGVRWFPAATLNYAEHALAPGGGRDDNAAAVIAVREDGDERTVTYGELRAEVAACAAGLAELGVRSGDRVVALAPNCPQTLVAFLAAASLGAVWSSCSPDFGVRAVTERFAQVEPTVLIAVDGYVYNGRDYDIRPAVAELRASIPSLRATVVVPYLDRGAGLPAGPHPVLAWADMLAAHAEAELTFAPVDFDHPLWILYSSGTTGLPKGIVQGHGGILLEHLKALALHCDLGPGDRFLWFTTTGWMMWNFLVGSLLVGATAVLYDGSPAYPDLGALWRLAERHRLTYFGTSAPYLQSCLKAGLRPNAEFDLSALRTVGSTGAPLSTDGFGWVADAVGPDVQIASISGGTDLCTAFVGAAPTLPVWLGELSGPMLGAAVATYDESGRPVVDEVGELVITAPMPSMPVAFWADPDGTRLYDAYFADFPGVWRHGDWARVTPRGSFVIYGRSDATLNRGGVRMGTAEFYRVVEGLPEIADSLVVDTSELGRDDGELLCFVVLTPEAVGIDPAALTARVRAALRSELSPRHVPDRLIVVDDIPKTLNGKKCEVPVKRILAGQPPDRAVSRDALQNPAALDLFVALAAPNEGEGPR